MSTKLAYTLLFALATALAAGVSRTSEKPSQPSHRFAGLGDLPGGAVHSAAYGVSADGSVVVGRSNSTTGMEAFRWTRGGGLVGLGFSEAFAVSDDGSAVAGYRRIPRRLEPVRWTQHDGPQGLGNIPECGSGLARGISADGSVIVGGFASSDADGGVAFHWTPARGMAQLTPSPNAVIDADAYAVSSDGEVVVGAIQHEPVGKSAFRWTSKSGLVDQGALPGDTDSTANAVSADGSVVVGISWPSSKAFRWTEETGMVDLGTLPGGRCSCAFGANTDGSIIVGQSDGEAFVWDASRGMRSVRQLLMNGTELDRSLRRWKLWSATAVSRNGSSIVGFGTNPSGNPEAWIARLGDDL